MSKSSIKSKAKLETEGIYIIRDVYEPRVNVKAELKWNGQGEMKTLGLSVAEGV